MPRKRLMVPMVTTIEGSLRPVTSQPLKAPQAMPTRTPMATRPGGIHARPARPPGPHQRRSQRDDRCNREVDLAGDDEQRHGEGDQRLLGEIERRVGERVGVEEIRRGKAVDDEDRHRNGEQQHFPGEAMPRLSGLPSRSGMAVFRGVAGAVSVIVVLPMRSPLRHSRARGTPSCLPHRALGQYGFPRARE